MSLPSNIAAALAALNTAFLAETPLASAGSINVRALRQQAADAVAQIDRAIVARDAGLGGIPAVATPDLLPSAVLAYGTSLETQVSLVIARGLVGRATSNINQIPT